MTNTPELIEQQLRDAFPFARQWLFLRDDPSENLINKFRIKDGDIQISLTQSVWGHWEAALEMGMVWTLSTDSSPTPAEAIANLQQAIYQVVTFAQDPLSEAQAALDDVRQYQRASLEHGTDRVYLFYETTDDSIAADEALFWADDEA